MNCSTCLPVLFDLVKQKKMIHLVYSVTSVCVCVIPQVSVDDYSVMLSKYPVSMFVSSKAEVFMISSLE